MIDSLKMGKRALTVAVAAATILWSVGISSFVAPMTARAASSGDLIKGTTLTTVYYYGSDGSRYAFPNEKTYFTWYSDFSDVETISDSDLAEIPLAGNVVYRFGTRWIKIQSDAKTYAVTPQGQIRWIESEEVAVDLAGDDWNTMIDDVPDTFFVDYTVGTSVVDAGDAYNGALVEMDSTNYLVWNDEMRAVSSAGFSANMFQSRNVLDGEGIDLAGLEAGDEITEEVSALTETAQLGEEVTGGLSVSLASDTPASATVPASASSVSFVKVKLMASSGSADVSQMVFHLGGVGAVDNLDNVFLYEGSMRLTDARSVNSSTRNVTFSGLDLSFDSGDSTYVTVRADITANPTGGDTASFALSEADSITSTATVSGSFPVSGNTMTFSETDAGTVEIDKTGSIADATIGEDEAEIAEFRVTADGEDAWLEAITLNVDDAGDHSNYELWNGSDLLAAGEQSNDLVTFELTDTLFIEDGDSEVLTMTADVGGESGDTIGVAVEEESDVVAIGGDYGFNLGVDIAGYDETGGDCAATTDDCSFSEIQGGELTFAFDGPSADDIQIDGEDEVLMEFTITAENWVEIKQFDLVFACNTDAATDCDEDNTDDAGDDTATDDTDDGGLYDEDDEANLQDLTVRESDGSTWMGPEELAASSATNDDSQSVTYTDDQILQAGESVELMVTVDVNSAAAADEVYFVTIDMSTVEAEDANGDDLATGDIVPASDITGHDFTLVDSSLDVDASTPPADGTYVKGSSDVSVSGFNFEAGNASDVTVTDVTYAVEGDTTGAFGGNDVAVGDHVSFCSIYDSESGSLVDGPESPTDNTADADIEFQNFSWTVEAGETAKLILKCDFSNTDLDDDTDDTFAFNIDDDADIVAEDDDGDDVSAAIGTDNADGAITLVTITDAGDITVSLDGSTASSTLILGASTGVSMSKFKFDATDEPFVVRQFELANCVTTTADADDDCADAGEADGSDDIAATVKLSYTNSDGETETKSGFLSSGHVNFDNLDLYVPTESTRSVTVTIDTNSVSSTGATSGSSIQLNFDAEASGAAEFEAIGQSSGETITEAAVDTYVVANDMIVHKTKPTFSLASGSPSGAGVPGLSEAFRFNVAADSRGFVTLNEVAFKVTAANDGTADDWLDCDAADLAADANFELYDSDDSSTKLDVGGWTFLESDGSGCEANDDLAYAVLDLVAADEGAEEIGAGETVTYVLRLDTTGASTSNDDSIRIDIPDQAETDALGTPIDAIVWEDDSDTDDIDATLVKNLPVTGGTIQY